MIGLMILSSMCYVACRKRRTRINNYGFFQGNTKVLFEDEDEQLFSINKARIVGMVLIGALEMCNDSVVGSYC
jgi:hypothetical protein